MCGACGNSNADWAAPLISGISRRREVAATLSLLHSNRRVEVFGERWVVAHLTGRRKVHDTLQSVVSAVTEECDEREWDGLHAWLSPCSEMALSSTYGDYLPIELGEAQPGGGREVLQECRTAHHKLLAFLIGTRVCRSYRVFVSFDHRERPFRIIADSGRLRGIQKLDKN